MRQPCHAIVFRDVREPLCLRTASTAVCEDLLAFEKTQDKDFLVSALLRAGEMECALGDQTGLCAPVITYLMSRGLVQPEKADHYATLAQRCLENAPYKGDLEVSRPEGFAFYGLHPLDYVDALDKMDLGPSCPILVIGVRSIGITLSEVVVSQLQLKFGATRSVQSLSVRPCGHPYDRRCIFDESQIGVITDISDSRVIVVDEGPGLSGSSFLSVGEALVAQGMDSSRISFLCSREVNPAELVTPNGAERWRRFQAHVVERNHFKPEDGVIHVPVGEWRNEIADESERPGLWTTVRPAVFRSNHGEHSFEYHGLGHYGADVRDRANVLAAAGFTTPVEKAANGFSRAIAVAGRRLTKRDLSSQVIDRMAAYLAFRVNAFPFANSDKRAFDFDNMARFNFREAAGRELPAEFCFPVHRVVISDSQMMPHQWLQPDDGSPLLKMDAAADGDNHFFPGPVDRAWDIAGVIIEWEMDEASREHLITRYVELASDDVRPDLRAYMVAYAAFRNGYCRMAASAMAHDAHEQARLLRDAESYRRALEANCQEPAAAAAGRVSSE